MESYFPENNNRSPSAAKDEIWHQWDDFVGAIQSFDNAAQARIDATTTKDRRVAGGAYKETTQSCKSYHPQFRED